MEYVQERVATLHDFGDARPDAPVGQTTVVVPMTERDHGSLAAERVLATLEAVDPERVLVALRAGEDTVTEVTDWLAEFDLPLSVLWCTAPAVAEHLASAGLAGPAGKGRDVWLALGVAAESDYVVVHDADARSYSAAHVPRLLFPLTRGAAFSKGYYARVENGRLYGRLARLFVAPVLRAVRAACDDPVCSYLAAFRYPLAGEFATTGDLARSIRAQRGWGLEVGTLGEAFAATGFEGSAQVDLGVHEHDHRSVGGPAGLGDMCREVGAALFRVLADNDVTPDYDRLADRYEMAADRLIDQYATDAAFNGLEYDPQAEREQVRTYARAIEPPGRDDRLPAWTDAPIEPEDVASQSAQALESVTER